MRISSCTAQSLLWEIHPCIVRDEMGDRRNSSEKIDCSTDGSRSMARDRWLEIDGSRSMARDQWLEIDGSGPMARDHWLGTDGSGPMARDRWLGTDGPGPMARDRWPGTDVREFHLTRRDRD